MKATLLFVLVLLTVRGATGQDMLSVGAGASIHNGFIENAGQWGDGLRYVYAGGPVTTLVEDEGLRLLLRASQDGCVFPVHLDWLGASPSGLIEPLEADPGYHNFLLGNDPAHWRTRVGAYRAIVYRSLYDGIDVVVRLTPQGQVAYDVLAEPGADLAQVRLQCRGAEAVGVEHEGTQLRPQFRTQSPAPPWGGTREQGPAPLRSSDQAATILTQGAGGVRSGLRHASAAEIPAADAGDGDSAFTAPAMTTRVLSSAPECGSLPRTEYSNAEAV